MLLFQVGRLWLVEMMVGLRLRADLPLPPELDLLWQVLRMKGNLALPLPATPSQRHRRRNIR